MGGGGVGGWVGFWWGFGGNLKSFPAQCCPNVGSLQFNPEKGPLFLEGTCSQYFGRLNRKSSSLDVCLVLKAMFDRVASFAIPKR